MVAFQSHTNHLLIGWREYVKQVTMYVKKSKAQGLEIDFELFLWYYVIEYAIL